MLNTEYAHFSTRETRTKYIAEKYRMYLKNSILDVGSDQCFLRTLLEDVDYTGIDVQGAPDIYQDLDQDTKLPFPDGSFDCVVCADVLEHLDNLHLVFDELVRVSRNNLIISLPNCWCAARKRIERGRGDFAHYGLPVEKPVDRHKWFFSLSQAKAFAEAKAEKMGLSIMDMHATEKPRPAIVRLARKLKYFQPESYQNRYAHTLWILFSKK